MTDIQINAGELHAASEPRTYIGDLLKWGEEGQTNLGRLTFDKGTLTLPRTPDALTVTDLHDPTNPAARITSLEDTGDVLRATFKVADTDEGDALIAGIEDGSRKALSVDVKNMVIRAGKAVSGALYGAAFVPRGAFPSAVLHAEIAADTPTLPAGVSNVRVHPDGTTSHTYTRTPEEMATEDARRKAIAEYVAALPPTPEETPVSEAEVTPESTPEKETEMADATVPNTLAASASTPDTSLSAFIATARAAKSGNRDAHDVLASFSESQTLHAAIADIKFDTTGSLGKGVVQPGFVGELWSGRRYERSVIPLLSHAPLTSLESKGWRFTSTPTVAPWAGNKTELPSSTATTESYTYKAVRFGHAVDIAREFYDFNETGVINRFLELVVDSYAEVSDQYILDQLLLNATATVANVATGTRSPGVTKILQGIRAVDAARGNASFALVADDVFEEILFSQDKEKLEYVSGQVGLNSGTIFGLNFVRHTGLADGQVLVGDKNAATVEEFAGSPIRISGIDLVRGGIDEAVVAYIAARFDKPSALVLIDEA